ncbi:hypothetical protein OSH11_17870 [Kaistia dalseonensis]|uniref:Uncharacterized protein n=1 Tax=Kaistia dalseonensis TaxID=410840 RepID=A0ABU0HA98_9HYPH|nr:hypothetical protein [Kaistia dalseonensis]MCX5496577.1 hypothetical protein [Kaistia dalseonensis]MDQ0439200.1 hypothetical protein [Kaistia dalseonensis]
MKTRLVPALGLAVSILAAGAFEARAEGSQSSFVRQHAIDMLEGALTSEQMTTLQLVAYQAAVAATCQGFTLDQARFEKVFDTLAPQDAAKMSDAQKAYFDSHILVIYGVLLGGELASIADNVSETCDTAREARTDPAMADELVWQ